ncbi:MAG: OsmC family protein [Alicyclobacillus sp.]|nr:OsmC family protein [Alicyclobacillus sp.]
MADLSFSTRLAWHGTGREGEGMVVIGDGEITYSAPEFMGGKGAGTSPEELLIAALGACYSGTLFGVLRKKGLPVEKVSIGAEGVVTGYPMQAKFSKLIVHPTIHGGDSKQDIAYRLASVEARDKCFIGKTIAGNVEYEVGDLHVISEDEDAPAI